MTFNDAGSGGVQDVIFDGENPRTFTARARTTISGGQFVVSSGAANTVGSCVALFNPGSIVVDLIHETGYANGIALHNAGSNEPITIATRGIYITTCGADETSGGAAVFVESGTRQYALGDPVNQGDKSHYSGTPVGRALTAADSGTTHYFLVDFHF